MALTLPKAASAFTTWWAMFEAECELAGAPIPDHAVVIQFMGSGASSHVTAGQLREIVAYLQIPMGRATNQA